MNQRVSHSRASSLSFSGSASRANRCVVHVVVTYRFAGTERIVLDLLERAGEEGWRLGVVIPPGAALDAFAAEATSLGATVARIGPLFESERQPAHNAVEIARFLRRMDATVTHFHYPWAPTCFEAVLAAWAVRCPVRLRTEHNPIVEPLPGKQRAKLRVLDRLVHRIVCVSSKNGERHVRNGGRPRSKIEVIPNGVTSAIAFPAQGSVEEIRRRVGLPQGVPLAVMVGALEERKGILDFVRTAARVGARSPVEFVVLGEGELRGSAEALARELGVAERVHFLGRRRDVRDVLRACDLYVQPSHYEGLSIAMLEALDVGLPMVSTEVDGVSDVFAQDADGALVCPVGDIDGLADRVVTLAGDSELRRRLGSRAQERVRSAFTVRRMCDDYMELYERLLTEVA